MKEKNIKFIGIPLLVVVLALIGGMIVLETRTTNLPEKRIENVVRILQHGPNNRFTLTSRRERGVLEDTLITCDRVVKIEDVSEGQPMWGIIKPYRQGMYIIACREIELHIHSAKDIGLGQWRSGKFRKGQTTVIAE